MIFRKHSVPILLALLGFALPEDATAAQHEARWSLPPMVLEAKGKPVPPGTRVLADVRTLEAGMRTEGRVGEKGRIQLDMDRHMGVGPYEVELFVGFLPHIKDEEKRVWYRGSLFIDTFPPLIHCRLKPKTAWFWGSGLLRDSRGKVIIGAKIRPVFQNNWGSQGGAGSIAPTENMLGGALLWDSRKTDRQGRFSIWSTMEGSTWDPLRLTFSKRGALGWSVFSLPYQAVDEEFEVSQTRALTFKVFLSGELPQGMFGFRLSTRHQNTDMTIPFAMSRMQKKDGARQQWRITVDPLPAGEYSLELIARPDGAVLRRSGSVKVTKTGVEYPDGSTTLDWFQPIEHRELHVSDIEGRAISGSLVSVHSRETAGPARHIRPVDGQGRVTMIRISGNETLSVWAPGYRVKKIRNPRRTEEVRLKPVSKILFLVPRPYSRPREGLKMSLHLQVLPSGRTPSPPGRVRAWWTTELDAKGQGSIQVGWFGPVLPVLILENKATHKAVRIRAIRYSPLRRLDRRKTPVELDFNAKRFKSALQILGIR